MALNEVASKATSCAQADESAPTTARRAGHMSDASNDTCVERAATRRHEDQAAEGRLAAGAFYEKLIMQDGEGDDGDEDMDSTDDGSAHAMGRRWPR